MRFGSFSTMLAATGWAVAAIAEVVPEAVILEFHQAEQQAR